MEVAIASGLVPYERVREGIEVGLHYLSFDRPEFITGLHVAADVGTADVHATQWAKEHGIEITRYWPSYRGDPYEAAKDRNYFMLKEADVLIAVLGGVGNCSGIIQMARQMNMPVYVHAKDHGL